MNTEDWLRKARLKYLIETYFRELKKEYIARRCRDDCTAAEKERIRQHNVLASKDFYHIGQRAAVTYFELKDPPVPTHFIKVVCSILAREYAFANDSTFDIDDVSHRLAQFVLYGDGSPIAILSNQTFPVRELSFEYDAPSGDGPFAEAVLAQRAAEFLRGGPPRHWDVIRKVAVQRPVEAELLGALQSGTQLIIVTSGAGDGKSTLLKRVAALLREDGSRVFLAEALDRGPFPTLPSCMAGIPGRSYLLIDNADMASSYPKLEDELIATPNLQVVLSARAYQWERKAFSWRRCLEIKIPTSSRAELENLAAEVTKWRASNEQRTRDELVAAMSSSVGSDHPHLLAAMMTATRGISFRAIIDGMIAEFEQAEEEWALRLVACGSLLNELTNGRVGRLPGYIFRHLVNARSSQRHADAPGRDILRKIMALSSEIVPLRTATRRDTTEYDLRHPDITNRILSRYFGLEWGSHVDDPDALLCDLTEILEAEFAAHRRSKTVQPLKWLRYSGTAVRKLLVGPRELYEWFPLSVTRGITRAFLQKFTSYQDDVEVRLSILLDWIHLELDLGDGIADEGYDSDERMSDVLLEEATSIAGTNEPVWFLWENLAAQRGEIGETFDPRKYSCLWIIRKCIDAGLAGENIYLRWFNLERARGNIGDVLEPAEGSARWIARTAWALNVRGEHILIAWIRFEVESGNLGSVDSPPPYSARWIAQTAWEQGIRSVNLIASWLNVEMNAENLGSKSHPVRFSARGIARAAWAEGIRWEQLTATSMNIEKRADNVGSLVDPERFSSRWFARMAWAEGERGTHFALAWMNLEVACDNVGEVVDPAEYSARWIARSLWECGVRSTPFVVAWMWDEAHWHNLGDPLSPEDYTSLWLGRSAWESGQRDEQFVANWMRLEAEAGHRGDAVDPERYSALWIGREAWAENVTGEQFLSTWMISEAGAGNVGELADPAQFSALWIGKTAYKAGARWEQFLAVKAQFENGSNPPELT